MAWVGFELLHCSLQLGISQRRAEWFTRWTLELSQSDFVNMTAFQQGLGRVMYVLGALGVREAALGSSVHFFVCLHPKRSVRRVPAHVCPDRLPSIVISRAAWSHDHTLTRREWDAQWCTCLLVGASLRGWASSAYALLSLSSSHTSRSQTTSSSPSGSSDHLLLVVGPISTSLPSLLLEAPLGMVNSRGAPPRSSGVATTSSSRARLGTLSLPLPATPRLELA